MEAVQEPNSHRNSNIQSHGGIDAVRERGLVCEPEIELEEGMFDDEMHPDVQDFLCKEKLHRVELATDSQPSIKLAGRFTFGSKAWCSIGTSVVCLYERL